jgi:outer membrane protein OmpA-like peptidoglycan-associated protein
VVLLNVYFDTGKASLKKASFEEIEKIEAFLKAHPEYKVKITGHTDYTGDPAKNDKLSIERANSVKDELVKRGINQGKILASGNGARNPIADNETKSGRAKNRRVEFQVLK